MSLALIIGASGAIGEALAIQLEKSGKHNRILRLARSGKSDIPIDLTNEASISAAAQQVAKMDDQPTCIIVASGILHSAEFGPEKALKQIEADWMRQVFEVNTIGPALVAKYFLPLMPRKSRFEFAVISARVGSISDNRLGGWHSYRASKAALNMIIKNCAIEWARRNDDAVIVALHPGTVDSALSSPFQSNVVDGKLFTAEYSAQQMLAVLQGLSGKDSGKHFAWDGTEIPG